MIPDIMIYFFVFLLLTYVFGNKTIPQLAVIGAILIQIISFVHNSLTTDYAQSWGGIILMIINFAYALSNIIVDERTQELTILSKEDEY